MGKILFFVSLLFVSNSFAASMSLIGEKGDSNKIDRDSSVVFIHSGGTPNLFTYSNELLATN